MTSKSEAAPQKGSPEKSPWEILSRIDVSDRIEKKSGLSYLSWAWAWGTVKDHYPYAWFVKHTAPNGMPYFIDGQGFAFVRVTVGLDRTGDHDVTEMLPVLDHRNKPIQGPNSFDVNNALQRCLAKVIAYHGLGHYIYAGEDMPAEAVGEPEKQAPAPAGAGQQAGASAHVAGSQPQETTIPMVKPDGETEPVVAAAKTVTAVFLSFIPAMADEKSLTEFYTKNKLGIAYLLSTSPDDHKAVMAAFASRKAEIKKQA